MTDSLRPEIITSGRKLEGNHIDRIDRKIKDLGDIFNDRKAYSEMDGNTVVYEVESYFPVQHNTEGGLFYGITNILPGTVGREYFMTKGHFHRIKNRGEIYTTIEGEGMLILMDEHRNTWTEKMRPGSVHYIPGFTAHRTANTGNGILSFWAVWPADAGHDYESISKEGFSKILVKGNEGPELIEKE